MKLALLSDLHANLQALEACLADARLRGATHHAFLGDLVGYGGDPGPVVDIVRSHAAGGAWVIKGNHDAATVSPPAGPPQRADQAGAVWTHARLAADQLAFLAGLPLMARSDDILMVHASVDTPERWAYVDTPLSASASLAAAQEEGARLVFGGHVHEQRLFYDGAGGRLMAFEPTPGVPIPVPAHRRWLATVGSVGQPRDGKPQAMYAMLDVVAQRLTFLRVDYDVEAAAEAIRRGGGAAADAARLMKGR